MIEVLIILAGFVPAAFGEFSPPVVAPERRLHDVHTPGPCR